ncbi:MAG: hypothetical protein HFG29_01465 [Eubacterium sp.]|nr:hypothetical protein [Eubacterium sp.]
MKTETKNIIAMITIFLLILIAVLVPFIFNKIFDGRMEQQIRYIADGKYDIVSSEEKSVMKRMEEIAASGIETGKVFTRIPIYMNDVLFNRIIKEYREWRKLINKNIDIFGGDVYLSRDITIYDNVSLYWDYASDVSFYVCRTVAGEYKKKQKYIITMFIDKETYKILYMQLDNEDLSKRIMEFWQEKDKNKYNQYKLGQDKEKNIDVFLKNYYHIPEEEFKREKNDIYIAKIFKKLEWDIWETPTAGIGIGIRAVDYVTDDDYYDDDSVMWIN